MPVMHEQFIYFIRLHFANAYDRQFKDKTKKLKTQMGEILGTLCHWFIGRTLPLKYL